MHARCRCRRCPCRSRQAGAGRDAMEYASAWLLDLSAMLPPRCHAPPLAPAPAPAPAPTAAPFQARPPACLASSAGDTGSQCTAPRSRVAIADGQQRMTAALSSTEHTWEAAWRRWLCAGGTGPPQCHSLLRHSGAAEWLNPCRCIQPTYFIACLYPAASLNTIPKFHRSRPWIAST